MLWLGKLSCDDVFKLYSCKVALPVNIAAETDNDKTHKRDRIKNNDLYLQILITQPLFLALDV